MQAQSRPCAGCLSGMNTLAGADPWKTRVECVILVDMNDQGTSSPSRSAARLRAAMVGMGMIFDETYRPFFETAHGQDLYDRRFGVVEVELAAVASRTGRRAEAYRNKAPLGMRGLRVTRSRRRSLSCCDALSTLYAWPLPMIAISRRRKPAWKRASMC